MYLSKYNDIKRYDFKLVETNETVETEGIEKRKCRFSIFDSRSISDVTTQQ